jgi:hypothetical protein
MWPNYYVIEARRLASERQAEAQRAHQAVLARQDADPGSPNVLRRSGARIALAVGRQSLRIARVLDECVADGTGATSSATPLG